MNTLTINVKREFWEHRSLWMAPVIWVAIITLMFAWAMFVIVPHEIGGHGVIGEQFDMGHDKAALDQLSDHDRQEVEKAIAGAKVDPQGHSAKVFASAFLGSTLFVTGFACVVVFFYLIDCLYTERRDRSILFWKSLPISDAQVVLSKLAVALVIVPLGAIALAAVMQLVMMAIVWLRFHGTVVWAAFPDWTLLAWFKSLVMALGLGLVGVLWYAPIAGYLLLMSSWARRNVFLWAVLPPIALVALEAFFSRSAHVAKFLGDRFGGYIRDVHVDPSALDMGTRDHGDPAASVDSVFSAFNLTGVFTHADIWLGLVAAAAMVFVAIRLRRYRDES